LKLSKLATGLGCRLEGDGTIEIVRVAGIQRAEPGDVTFLTNSRYAADLATTRASAVIVGLTDVVQSTTAALLRSDNPYAAFARAIMMFAQGHSVPPPPGVDRLSAVAPDATIGAGAAIGPFVTIGAGAVIGPRTIVYPNVVIGAGVRIGEYCVIRSHVTIRDRITIGDRVILHDGVVVGSDGFGFARETDGTHLKILQLADVVIEDDVEIGANSTIDRPALGETRIGAGTKIDNLVHIAHGVAIGRRTLLAAQVGIAGSTTLEDRVTLAGQVGVAGHLTLGTGVVATAQTGIPNSVEAGSFVSGYPAIPNRDWLKSSAVFRKLPELRKTLSDLERRLAALEEKMG